MGAKGIKGIDVLEKISEKTEERLKIILNYYKKKGKIKKADKYFNQHSLIIVFIRFSCIFTFNKDNIIFM